MPSTPARVQLRARRKREAADFDTPLPARLHVRILALRGVAEAVRVVRWPSNY
jgi:hypothetical protein